jgi:hypothetical protein
MPSENPNVAYPKPLRFATGRLMPIWIAVATLLTALIFGAFADWWDFLKTALIGAGSGLAVLAARRYGWNSNISMACAGAIGGFLAFGSLGFFLVLFPPPPEPGTVNWGGRSTVAATYIFLMGGLLGGFVGGLVGLLAATIECVAGKLLGSKA